MKTETKRAEIDAPRDLETIRLRNEQGQVWDVSVGHLTRVDRTDGGENGDHMTTVRPVPTWHGIPIPDLTGYDNDLPAEDACDVYLNWWKRGVTDANNATSNGDGQPT